MTADVVDVVYTTEDQKHDNYFGVNLYNVINQDTKTNYSIRVTQRIRL